MSAQQKIKNDQNFDDPKGPSANQTPESIKIKPRHLHFEVKDELATLWHGGDVFKTAFFNALSLQFPRGERHFIDSVRHYRDRVADPALQENIRGFIGQEGMHSKEHEIYNEALAQRGYDIEGMDKRFSAHMDYVYSKRKHLRLAGTCAAEHYTAVLAHGLLNNPDWLQGASPRMKALWRWHAIEEIEHKSVAYDVYQSVIGIQRVRIIVFFIVSHNFFKYTFLNTCSMLKTEGKLWSLSTWLKGMNYLWGKPGVIRKCLPMLLRYLRRDFHPWQLDERNDLKNWSRHLEESGYGT